MLLFLGCGQTKSYTATEQLLLSDAVDTAVAKIDFAPMEGQKVYFDTTYLKTQRSPLLIDSDYVISSLRQQMVSSGVYLVENRDEADLIAEARMGALGLDGHSVVYGLPASNALSSASAIIPGAASIPAIPEISLARKENTLGAAKVAVFAYEKDSREPFWQSGIARSSSNAKDTWVFGVGPFQRGTIHKDTRFAGDRLAGTELIGGKTRDIRSSQAYASYLRSKIFTRGKFASQGELASADAANATPDQSTDAVAGTDPAATGDGSQVVTAAAKTP